MGDPSNEIDEIAPSETGYGMLNARASFDGLAPSTVKLILDKIESEAQKRVQDGFNRLVVLCASPYIQIFHLATYN